MAKQSGQTPVQVDVVGFTGFTFISVHLRDSDMPHGVVSAAHGAAFGARCSTGITRLQELGSFSVSHAAELRGIAL